MPNHHISYPNLWIILQNHLFVKHLYPQCGIIYQILVFVNRDFCQKCGKIARNRNKPDKNVWKCLKNYEFSKEKTFVPVCHMIIAYLLPEVTSVVPCQMCDGKIVISPGTGSYNKPPISSVYRSKLVFGL